MKDKKSFLNKKKKSIQLFLEKNVDEKRKAISPLIASILLIIVAIVIIIMVISWSRTVTDDSLDFDLETMYDLSNYSDYVWYDRITGPTLQIKNLGSQSFEIKSYKINSSIDSPYLNELITLDEPIQVLNNNTGVIPLFCIPEDEFTVEIVTSDNTYFNIPVKNARTRISSCSLDFEITSPEEGSTFFLSQEVSFSSEINKTLGDYTCSWSSNIDGSLSSDCSFTTSSLQEGTHQITLTVQDDFSQETQEIIIDIKDNLGAEITSPNNNDTFNHNETITLIGGGINYHGDVTCSWSSNHDSSLGEGCTLENVSLSENTHTITLTVQDGLEIVTDNITLAVGSLSVSILSPLNNSEYEEGDSIFFEASAEYPYQGNYSCSWDSNIADPLSSDCSFTKSDLSLGSHEITLEVDDGFSTDSVNINLIINEPSPCSGLPYIVYSGNVLCIHPTGSGTSQFCSSGDHVGGGSFTDGYSNTQFVFEYCTDPSFAGKLCFTLNFGGFNDWYLPARNQLIGMYDEKDNVLGDYSSSWIPYSSQLLWSSTTQFQFGTELAYTHDMSLGNGNWDNKDWDFINVRCVRDP